MITVLDWGLGHAGRSIPLIQQFRNQGAKVILASSGRAGLLLQKAFPDLLYLEAPAYRVHYRGRSMYWTIFRQLPKITSAIYREHLWLRRLLKMHRVDAVVSDSRFGTYQSGIPSVILTHQLRLVLQPAWLSKTVNFLYRGLLARFHEVWVPDHPNGISGILSHPSPFAGTHYLGCLSRFRPTTLTSDYDLLVLLSGPEPQRTRLENLVLDQLQALPIKRALIVQGKTDLERRENIDGRLEVISYLAGEALQQAIARAGCVLCRSGYSSIMDLARMRKKAVLVPTPGQPEQEYLAQRCAAMGWAIVQQQRELNIGEALDHIDNLEAIDIFERAAASKKLAETVARFLATL